MMADDRAEPFMFPVDTGVFEDYEDIVEEPMDLSTIQVKLQNGEYGTSYQVRDLLSVEITDSLVHRTLQRILN